MFPVNYSEIDFFCITNHENFEGFYFVLIWNGNIPSETLKLFFLYFYSEYLCRLFPLPDEHAIYFKL